MGKKDIKRKLDEKIAELKNLCKDTHHASKLINEILSLKAQLDIDPSIIHIPIESIEKDKDGKNIEIDGGHYKLIRTKKGIVVSVNGYKIIVSSWIKSLYDQLDFFIESKMSYNLLTEEEKDNLDTLISGAMTILIYPLIGFYDDSWIDVATDLTRRENDLFDKYLDMPLQEETLEEDNTFKESTLFINEIGKGIE